MLKIIMKLIKLLLIKNSKNYGNKKYVDKNVKNQLIL